MISRRITNDEPDQETAAERAGHRVAKARAEARADLAGVREWIVALRLLSAEAPAAAADGLREIREAVARLAEEVAR